MKAAVLRAFRDGCKRNATKHLSKTAKIVRKPIFTHVVVVASRLSRLRLGTQRGIISKIVKILTLMVLMMMINKIVKHKATATATAPMNISKTEKRFLHEICSTDVKWENACRGHWNNDSSTVKSTKKHIPLNQIISQYRIYKKSLLTTYNELKLSTSEIDVSDVNTTWQTYKDAYWFLPRIEPKFSLKLRSWHRKAKIYAGSFNYLRRAQLYFDLKQSNFESNLSKSLKNLELAALKILCEIEATINITTQNTRSLHRISPAGLKNLIHFDTEMKYFFYSTPSSSCREEIMNDKIETAPIVNFIDLQYAKKQFLNFLRAMRKQINWKIIILQNKKRKNQRHRYKCLYDSQEISLELSQNNSIAERIQKSKHIARRHGNKRRHHRIIT